MRILFKLNQHLQQRQHEKTRWIFPIQLAMYATHLRNQGNEIIWDSVDDGTFDKVIASEKQIDIPFLQLPHADRVLTCAKEKKWQQNGNFKYLPATYILSAIGCHWGECTFCVEQGQPYEVRKVEDVIDEINECKTLGFKEVFDDSATFPIGRWLDEFCNGLARVSGELHFSCNMRMVDVDYVRMCKSGFRMVLFGLESANQKTLNKINKGVRLGGWNGRIPGKKGEGDVKYIIKAAKAGLEPHIAVMFGYPWETEEDAVNTLKLVHYLLRKGYAKTAQASFYAPQGGQGGQASHRKYVNKIYRAAYSPTFWLNKIRDIHNVADLKYLWRQIKEGMANA